MAFKWLKRSKNTDEIPQNGAAASVTAGDAPVREEPAPADDATAHQPEPAADRAQAATNNADPADDAAEEPDSGPDMEPTATEPARKGGLFSRLKSGLRKTRTILTTDIDELFTGKQKVDAEMLEDLEELLITADIGVQTAMELVEEIGGIRVEIGNPDALRDVLKSKLRARMTEGPQDAPAVIAAKPRVVMVIGVNGVGKTTTIGKLAAKATAEGKKVLIAACDTFRAAAIEQIGIWAERANADIVRHKDNADPAAVAFDAVQAAQARNVDLVLVDTAGRLHTKVNLMEELKKIHRSIAKQMPGAPHEILLVLDATTGQNALSQARLFNEAMPVTGLALTKIDGTAKGGIVVGITGELNVPLKYIGVGEQIDDLQTFDAEQFVEALF